MQSEEVKKIIQIEPLGQYSRKIWFLYEWLFNKEPDIPNLEKGNFVPLIDEKTQYAISGNRSSRHGIINNLPGVRDFCPMIYKTEKLKGYQAAQLSEKTGSYLQRIHADVLQRASAFLLLKDSKASLTIEGEASGNRRAKRWGKAIGQAGTKKLDTDELLRLQQIVIESSRFTKMGFRKQGGFVGEYDRTTGEPIPDHISARWQDITQLIKGLISTNTLLESPESDAVLAAAIIAFGVAFIHPFVDGNGRIHRYIIHHILARKEFTKQGVIFPVSASILDHIKDYKNILESILSPPAGIH